MGMWMWSLTSSPVRSGVVLTSNFSTPSTSSTLAGSRVYRRRPSSTNSRRGWRRSSRTPKSSNSNARSASRSRTLRRSSFGRWRLVSATSRSRWTKIRPPTVRGSSYWIFCSRFSLITCVWCATRSSSSASSPPGMTRSFKTSCNPKSRRSWRTPRCVRRLWKGAWRSRRRTSMACKANNEKSHGLKGTRRYGSSRIRRCKYKMGNSRIIYEEEVEFDYFN